MALLTGLAEITLAAEPQPNVVLFLVDDLGWTDWEANGAPYGSRFYETPHLNRLAQEGVRFDRAYSASPVCSPSRAAILTGLSPARSHFTQWIPGQEEGSPLADPDWQAGIRSADQTLAEAFRDAGYGTQHLGKWHVGEAGTSASNPLLHGFNSSFGGSSIGTPPRYFADETGSFGLPGLRAGSAPPGAYLTDHLTVIATYTIGVMASAGRPFFLLVSHYAVHKPLQAKPDLVARYEQKEPDGGHDDARYAAMIESVDESLGSILDALEQHGLRDDTIVVFTSDNGGSLAVTSNRPLRGGKGLLYEGGLRVPLVVSWTGNPAIEPGRASDALVVGHDLHPTLLDLAGVPADPVESIDGLSFRPAVEGGLAPRDLVPFHYPHVSPQWQHDPEGRGGRYVTALRTGPWKLLYHYEEARWELFDLATDPWERLDVSLARWDAARMLGFAMTDWLAAVDAQMPYYRLTWKPVRLPTPLPEPARGSLLVSALVVLAWLNWRRSSCKDPAAVPRWES